MKTKLFNKARSTVHILATITCNLTILDPTISYNNIEIPARLMHFYVNAKVTCRLDVYYTLSVLWHNYFTCGAVRKQDLTTFLATLERFMLI
jgi:hypothetical protein